MVVAGFVTNIVVTAYCVWRVCTDAKSGYYSHWAPPEPESVGRFEVRLITAPGKAIFDWAGKSWIGTRPGPASVEIPSWVTMDERTAALLWEAEMLYPARGPLHGRTQIAYGWPRLSFRGGILQTPAATLTPAPGSTTIVAGGSRASVPITVEHDFGLALPDIHGDDKYVEPRTIPYVPIVRGVLVNTAFYGAAWWVAPWIRGVVLLVLRRRRGACRECGYDRRGIAVDAVCPECGANAPAGRGMEAAA